MTTHFYGKITRLVVGDSLSISLGDQTIQPSDNYFRVMSDHPNYKAIFSLASMAAMSGHRFAIRTTEDISEGDRAEVSYVFMDF